MKKGLELTTNSKISGDMKLGIPQPQQQPPQNIYNLHYSTYIISVVDHIILAGYTSIFENPIFLLGLLGFAGVCWGCFEI